MSSRLVGTRNCMLINTCTKPGPLMLTKLKLQSVDNSKRAGWREIVPTIVTCYQNVPLAVRLLTGIKPSIMQIPHVIYIEVYAKTVDSAFRVF